MEVRAVDVVHPVPLSIFLLIPQRQSVQDVTVFPASQADLRGLDRMRLDGGDEAPGVEDARAVGRDLDAGADLEGKKEGD